MPSIGRSMTKSQPLLSGGGQCVVDLRPIAILLAAWATENEARYIGTLPHRGNYTTTKSVPQKKSNS